MSAAALSSGTPSSSPETGAVAQRHDTIPAPPSFAVIAEGPPTERSVAEDLDAVEPEARTERVIQVFQPYFF